MLTSLFTALLVRMDYFQGYFDMIQLPYSTSGVLVEAMTFNKFVLNNYLRGFGYNVAKSMVVYKDEAHKISAKKIESELGMPCFIKPAADGSSFGVSKVKTKSDIPAALELAFNESNEVMIESFLQGTEISIGCYATKEGLVSLPATEVVTENEFFDYNAKYNGQVQEITPARLQPDTAERVANQVKKSIRYYVATELYASTTSLARIQKAMTFSIYWKSTPLLV